MSEKLEVGLYQKIQNVANAIRILEKDMKVGDGRYAYQAISDLNVTLAVKDAERENNLVSIPVKIDLISSETIKTMKENKESLKFIDNIKMTLRIVDLETGDFLDIESLGKGIDSGDKGYGKASTYARKYALLNAYKIATGEDPDAEKSPDIVAPKTVSEKRKQVTDYLNLDNNVLVETLSHFSVTSVDDLTDKNIEDMHRTLTHKKKL